MTVARCFTCRDPQTNRGLLVEFEGQETILPTGVHVMAGACPTCGDRVMLILAKPERGEPS